MLRREIDAEELVEGDIPVYWFEEDDDLGLPYMDWLADEMETLTSPGTYEQHPENAWERLRHRVRKPRDLAVLMELAAWREHEAQSRDVPRSRILKDDILVEIAQAAPPTAIR